MSSSRFVPSVDLTRVAIAGFRMANDPAVPTFRPDPEGAGQFEGITAKMTVEIEEEMSQENGNGPEASDDNDEFEHDSIAYVNPSRLVSTELSNEDILAGPSRLIARERLLQLRHTMDSRQILESVVARHGENDPITLKALMRRYSNAPRQIAKKYSVSEQDVKDALSKATAIARVRKTDWTRSDVAGYGKRGTDIRF